MKKPLIDSTEQNDMWIFDISTEIINAAVSQNNQSQKEDIESWGIFNNNEKDYDKKYKYLTEVEGFTYPAKFRRVGEEIIRSKLNLLISKQYRRTFRFKAVAVDERSLKEKHISKQKSFIKAVKASYEERHEMLNNQIQQVQDKLADLKQQAQQQPNEQNQQQLQILQANLPLIEAEYGKIIRALSREKLDMEDLQKKIDYYEQNSEYEIMQQIANAGLKSAIQKNDLYEQWNSGFIERIVTGKPSYIVYYDQRKKDVVLRQIDALQCYHSKNGNNKWTQNGEWCAVRENMNESQIFSEFELSDFQRKSIEYMKAGDYAMAKSYSGNTVYMDSSNMYDGVSNSFPVWRIWFLQPREVWYRKQPNKHAPGTFFYNLCPSDYRCKEDEEKKRIIIYDLYASTIIGGYVCVNHGRQDMVYRSKDMPGLPCLPLVAKSFNKISDRPYSLVQRTKELKDLYNVVNYKKEMAIALAGVKGMVMDQSQKPDTMSLKMWTYYRKMGTMWIETMKKGRKVPATFNQFQTFDDGITDSIQWFDYILNGIEGLISKISGITPAAEGQFVSKDPVASVKMSNEQSALITESLFYDNDNVFMKALDLYLNLKSQFVWNKGETLSFLNEDLAEVLVNIPANLLNNSDFQLFTNNNIKEDSLLEDVRNIAIQTWSRMQLPLSSLVSLFKVEDLNEMENKLIQYAKQAEEIQQQNAAAAESAKSNGEMQKIQFEKQFDADIAQMNNQLQQAALQIQQANLDLENQKFQWEAQFKERELQTKTQLDSMKISSQNQIESMYANEESRANRVNEMFKATELKLNTMLESMALKMDDIHHKHQLQIDMKDINMRNKVNLKN